ncbi:MAG: hypothetical protein KDA37_18230 [Planctomycetales bacterium]|nr:hypothetical protein [Planctomycetales bacterium]
MPDSTAGVATRNVSGKRRAGGTEAQQPDIALERLGVASSPALLELLPRLIVTVAAWKGGVGKTELAKELAFLLGGVLSKRGEENLKETPYGGGVTAR